jgi:hypothetical protein
MKLDKKGQSSLLLAVFLGGLVAALGVDLMNRLQAASKIESNLRMRSSAWQDTIQLAQMVKAAYDLGQYYNQNTGCTPQPCTESGCPVSYCQPTLPNGGGQSTTTYEQVVVQQGGAGSGSYVYFLFPQYMDQQGTTSACVENFCIQGGNGSPSGYSITAMNDQQFHQRLEDQYVPISHDPGFFADFPFAQAEAASTPLPFPYLSPVPAAFPSVTANYYQCPTGGGVTSSACVVCGDQSDANSNADCVQVTICTNGSTTCPATTSGTGLYTTPYIQPRFAFLRKEI